MASTYSSNLKIELIGTGEQSGTWGSTTNTNLGTAIEEAIVGRGVANFASDADLTLTLTNSNASQTARAFAIRVESSVSLSATRNLIVPTMYKPYIINNVTTGGQSIVVKTASGAGVTVPNGKRVFVYTNNTEVVEVLNFVTALSLGTALAVTDGGTGATTAAGARTNLGAASLTGVETLTNKTIEAGTFTNGYTEETVTANTGTAYTIDLANGTVQILTLTGNCTYTFPTATAGRSFLLVQKQDGAGGRTVTWPAAVKWPGSTAPTLTSTANKADVYAFTADGTNWIGRVVGVNYL